MAVTELSTGWQCKQSDDDSEDAWLPVRKVPSVIHLDLQENGKYVGAGTIHLGTMWRRRAYNALPGSPTLSLI